MDSGPLKVLGTQCPYFAFVDVLDGGVAQQVGGLGSEVLQMVFKFHRVAQQEVLSQLLNRIITGCSSPSVDSYFSEWVGVTSVCWTEWAWLTLLHTCLIYCGWGS